MVRIEDVIDREYYVDRRGISRPNKLDESSIYFINRVDDLFLSFAKKYAGVSEDQSNVFLDSYRVINDMLVKHPRKLYKDSTPKNMVWGRYGNVVAIDFERLTLMPPQLELVKLLEFDSKEYLAEEQIEKLLQQYIWLEEQNSHAVESKNFLRTYYAAGAHSHLCLAGYITSYFHFESVDRGEFMAHLNRAKRHIKRLAEELDRDTHKGDGEGKTEGPLSEKNKIITESDKVRKLYSIIGSMQMLDVGSLPRIDY